MATRTTYTRTATSEAYLRTAYLEIYRVLEHQNPGEETAKALSHAAACLAKGYFEITGTKIGEALGWADAAYEQL